jgi:short-subunit dehydrogenase
MILSFMNKRAFNIQGKVIWLTGATSGIGEALAFELARRGAKLAITARRKEVLDKIVDEIKAAGGDAAAYDGDIGDLERMKSIAGDIERQMGPIDCLIPNAGTHIFTKPEQFDSAEYLSLMSINYGGMLRCIEAVLPSMIKRKSGYIAGMCSLSGIRALPMAAAYGASKAAMIHFLESIRYHLVPLSIPVTVINPGFVKTPLTDKNHFPMPFLIEAPRAAKIICDGLERQKKEISFPWPFNWILSFARFIPETLYAIVVNYLWSKIPQDKK